MKTLGIFCLLMMLSNSCIGSDLSYQYSEDSHYKFHVEFVTGESAWQILNVIDMLQTIQIAKNSHCYKESGQLGLFTGPHPSKNQAIIGLVGFGLVHFLAGLEINSLQNENEDYRVLQNVYQVTGLAWKGYTVWNNNRIGLKLDHSRSCGY